VCIHFVGPSKGWGPGHTRPRDVTIIIRNAHEISLYKVVTAIPPILSLVSWQVPLYVYSAKLDHTQTPIVRASISFLLDLRVLWLWSCIHTYSLSGIPALGRIPKDALLLPCYWEGKNHNETINLFQSTNVGSQRSNNSRGCFAIIHHIPLIFVHQTPFIQIPLRETWHQIYLVNNCMKIAYSVRSPSQLPFVLPAPRDITALQVSSLEIRYFMHHSLRSWCDACLVSDVVQEWKLIIELVKRLGLWMLSVYISIY
jgi:hypothetical protein